MIDFSDPELRELFESFLVESDELLDNISQDLIIIENQPQDIDLINKIFRGFHTIKGTSSFMGLDNVSGLTHEAEELLNKLRKSELIFTGDIGDALLRVHDIIREMIENIKSGSDEIVDIGNIKEVIITLRNDKPTAVIIETQNQSANNNKNSLNTVLDGEFATGDGDFTDEELDLLQAAFADMNSQFVDEIKEKDDNSNGSNIVNNDEDIDKINSEIQVNKAEENKKIVSIADTQLQTKQQPNLANAQNPNSAQNVGNESLRIDVSRLETLMNLSGELVLSRNRLIQLGNSLENKVEDKEVYNHLVEALTQIDFVTSEIQTAVMKMRMVPVGKLFQKAQRIVRDLSKELGKNINLILKGEDTEIDKNIVEELNDPLVHMIRNSCDHGVESPDKRELNGKSATGTITLAAEQHGNHIVISITDDGAGLDANKLKAKAVEKGLMTQLEADALTEAEAYKIIFLPGFSTAAKVTGVSGRGVGMDVVRTNIEKLRGFIDIESELGKGSSFSIKLPLTLAIIQGLLIKVENEIYAIPLSSVEEVVSIDTKSVKTLNNREVIKIRDNVYPIIRLNQTLNCATKSESLENKNVVLVAVGYDKIGLVVDNLLGQEEIVIKSMGPFMGNIKGLAGATITGDGKVIMILDIDTLIKN